MVALVQGAMGGLMFAVLGLAAPALWGLVMATLAIVPVLGTFVVWLPAAAFLALDGRWGRALILAVWGGVAVVGGLLLFGPSGAILGPVVLAVTDALLDVWRRRTAGGRAAETGIAAA